jgi:aminoglycoside phosphotransferase (APT) family kinase protein
VLLHYLGRRLGVKGLSFAAGPAELPNGWETDTYEFRLRSREPLPQPFTRPLILRVFASDQGLSRARHEHTVQTFLARAHYPVPRPLLLEERCDYFGGPFILRAKAPGQPMLAAVLRHPWRLFQTAAQMAEAQAWLHRLPEERCPSPSEPFLKRDLETCRRVIDACGLDGLRPGLDWLEAHRPGAPPALSVLHLDFHPRNLIQQGNGPPVVVDWTEADVGDYHADLGTSVMLLECAPAEDLNVWDRVSTWAGRFVFLAWYLHVYRQLMRVETAKLTYYRAWAAFRRLCRYGSWLHDGPEATGYKPAAVEHLCPVHVQTLTGYFRKWAGIGISLRKAD